jgi:hypothetical protein
VGDTIGNAQGAQREIGRQIVLPFSKAFEIAWQGMKIRLWRSLITMSGIVLAIAFLMSVWTTSVFNRTLRNVAPEHELYPLVQSALEAEAIAGGGERIRCAVLEHEDAPAEGEVAPGTSIRHFLNAQGAFHAARLPATPEAVVEALAAPEEKRPDCLILTGLHPMLLEAEVAEAADAFVRQGGVLLVYGTKGIWSKEGPPLADLLPARVLEGTFMVSAGQVQRGERSVDVLWQEHPPVEFVRTRGEAGSTELASADGVALVWSGTAGEGTVYWYPVAPSASNAPDVISWFVRGRTTRALGEAQGESPSLLARLLVRGAGGTRRGGDMRGIWLVTLSLMVCIVGITNAMLMSVTERFREIGTMKCLGALDKFVVKLFLIESSLQGVVGSCVGAFVGFVLAFVRALFTFHVTHLDTGQSYWLALRFFPVLDVLLWLAIALVVGVVLSVVAAIYPAIRAARMEPVEAMRVEA